MNVCPIPTSCNPFSLIFHVYTEIESLGKEEVECEAKTIVIEFNSNEQGQFMKISEVNGAVCIIN